MSVCITFVKRSHVVNVLIPEYQPIPEARSRHACLTSQGCQIEGIRISREVESEIYGTPHYTQDHMHLN